MPTLEVAVDLTILIMCSVGEVRSPYSAVAIQELEYTTAGQEMKPELSVFLVSFIFLGSSSWWILGNPLYYCRQAIDVLFLHEIFIQSYFTNQLMHL